MKRIFFIIQIAFKDATKNLTSLSILASCCFIGTLALVSISLLKEGVNNSIYTNTKSLLAADFLITSRQPLSPEANSFILDLEENLNTKLKKATEISLASMVLFKSNDQSRLIQLTAVSDSYPLYGEVKTELNNSLEIKSGEAIVDYNLKIRYNLKIGDEIKIGNKSFKISDFILQMPGSISTRSILAPRILINISDIDDTNLIKKGSLVRYLFYFKSTSEVSSKIIKERLSAKVLEYNLTLETVDEKRQSIERTVSVAYKFLDVITFLSLILGAIGIASGSYIYFRKKREFISTLLCLGLKKFETIIFFSVQILLFGLLAIAFGSLGGVLINSSLPGILAQHLPVELSDKINFVVFLKAIFTSIMLLILSTSFSALLIWKQGTFKNFLSILIFSIFTLIWIFILGKLITDDVKISLIYTFSILALILTLTILGYFLRSIAKLVAIRIAEFKIEQGIKNLYRPNNQTFLLVSTIGISSLTIFLSLFISTLAGNKITKIDEEGSSNLLLFDIQEYQLDGVSQLLKTNNLPLISKFPIVNMRIENINGVAVKDLRNIKLEDDKKPAWTLTREYRSTYRDFLDETEKIIAGNFVPEVNPESQEIPVSIEEGLAEKLDLKISDTILFNVQGLLLNTYISSIRKVDWQQMKPNFFFIFPKGILDDAPKNFILLSKYKSEDQNNVFQSTLIKSYGNVSSIDLSLILKTISGITNQLKRVIEFLSLIVIANSVIILIGIILGSRAIRIEENTILRTLGAKDRVIQGITFIEYAFVAFFGVTSGLLLAVSSSIIIGQKIFSVLPVFNPLEILSIFCSSIFLITFFGVLGSIGTLKGSTLETLRNIES